MKILHHALYLVMLKSSNSGKYRYVHGGPNEGADFLETSLISGISLLFGIQEAIMVY
jgi:hypothetical protein